MDVRPPETGKGCVISILRQLKLSDIENLAKYPVSFLQRRDKIHKKSWCKRSVQTLEQI